MMPCFFGLPMTIATYFFTIVLSSNCFPSARRALPVFATSNNPVVSRSMTFAVDADGLLQVEAREQTSGVSATVEVKPSYGLTDDEVTDMLQASIDHAQGDMATRRLVEEKVEAQRVIEALTAALNADGDELLSADERATVDDSLARLAAVADESTDSKAVEAAIKQLEKDCEFYVERRMNSGIRKAMAGHRVDDFASRDDQ